MDIAGSLKHWFETGSRIASEHIGGTALEWRMKLQCVEFVVLGFASTQVDEFQDEENVDAVKSFLRTTFRQIAAD